MKLVDEIIEMASDGSKPLTDVLRKCLVLAFELKNEKLKEWVELELNGYREGAEIPEYRKVMLYSRGNFSGPWGAWVPNRPLPLSVIDKKHRGMLTTKLAAPIASYEGFEKKTGEAVINWPPDLIAMYQTKFMEGFALSQAWQEVPTAMIAGLRDAVRNRLLRFALEIKEELGEAGDRPANVPQEKVEAAVINHIYGGVNMIGGTVNTQIGNIDIREGDLESLKAALLKSRVPEDEVKALEHAISDDAIEGKPTFGKKTAEWLASFGGKVAKAGVGIGKEVAQEWLFQYLGLK
jgi:hypothetical protein